MPRIESTSLANDFQTMNEITSDLKEANDCAVKAVALLANVGYIDAHAKMAVLGRQKRKGTARSITEQALKEFGVRPLKLGNTATSAIIARYPGVHKGLQGVTTHHPRRFPQAWAGAPDMLFFTSGHVAAKIGDTVIDWSINNALRVKTIWIRESDLDAFNEWLGTDFVASPLGYVVSSSPFRI